MAKAHRKSVREAGLDLAVQKDVWHIERDGAQVRTDLERAAFHTTRQVMELEKQLLEQWDDALFAQKYIPAVAKEEQVHDQHDAFSHAFTYLCDALEVVDMRSGEIRDPQTNGWLLEESLTALEQIDHDRVYKWVRTLRRHQKELLTYLDWLAASLRPYEQELAQTLPSAQARTQFMRRVARVWCLRQALINEERNLRTAAQMAEQNLTTAIGGCPRLTRLAQRLNEHLDATCRASSRASMACSNSSCTFPSVESLQRYLNLFALWHNLRVYQRDKRQGQRPYQRAGIHTGNDDWLALLGYPAV